MFPPFENWNTRSVPSYNATVGLRYLQEAINLWPFQYSPLVTAIFSAPKKHLLKFERILQHLFEHRSSTGNAFCQGRHDLG